MAFYFIIVVSIMQQEAQSNDDVDFKNCKFSHMGLEFMGDVSKTESGVRCQSWTMRNPIHKIDSSYTDDNFPERSMAKAKNYCRNPSNDPKGPWCYTVDPELINDTCAIPLCSNVDCKLTATGMEYAGHQKKSVSGKSCLKWDKHRSKVKAQQKNFETYEQRKFPRWKFPDETRGSAKKYCRNPDGDVGGPWCFVELEDIEDTVEKEYCDIPLCDDQVRGFINFFEGSKRKLINQ